MTRMTQGGHVVMADKWKQCARAIKRDAHALYLAARDPRVPWYAKALAIAVAAYALSPIDLIPDFVPVLGYVDDLIIVPAGMALVIRLIPPEIMAEHREMAIAAQDRPVSRAAAAAIVTIWVVAKNPDADASRVIQGVMTGVGFLGAGVIVHLGRKGQVVHGLSTAATIWITASLGVLCGLAAWRLLAVAFVLTVLLLVAGGAIENWLQRP